MMVLFWWFGPLFFWMSGFQISVKKLDSESTNKKTMFGFIAHIIQSSGYENCPIFLGRRQKLDGDFNYFFSPYSTWGRNFHPILTCASFFKKGLVSSTKTNLEKHLGPNVRIFSPKNIQSSWVWKSPHFFRFWQRPQMGQHLRKRTFAHISQKTAFGAPRPQKRPGSGLLGLKWRWGLKRPIFPRFFWWQMKVFFWFGVSLPGKCIWVFPKIGRRSIMENPIKMDDLGGTPIFGNTHINVLVVTIELLMGRVTTRVNTILYCTTHWWYIKTVRARPMKRGIKDRYTIGSCGLFFLGWLICWEGTPLNSSCKRTWVSWKKTQGALVILRRFPQQNPQLNSMNPFFKLFCRQSWK